MTTLREAAALALDALLYIHTETSADEDEIMHEAITALRAALEEPLAKQIRPSEFIALVEGKETVAGRPVFWAEWPNKE